MGSYNRHIMPRMIDCLYGMAQFSEQRQKVVPRAQGLVVEIGIGSGLNLPHYDAGKVHKVIGVDPDEQMWKAGRNRVRLSAVPVERVGLSGEQIPLEKHLADTVLVTYSLCTIPDVVAALTEMRRILKPGGRLLFLEHGAAPEESVRKWQARIDPVWKRIAGGCHSGRPIPQLLEQAGWKIDEMEQAYISGPKPLAYNYWGSAGAG
ncbi:MAG: class I SAM-dependent methyltransferase [Pseudomonadota bacterium]